ncbi:MAG: protein kinase [Proteobacteria bacterium]|nr:protein kinase [Pseudomonadota bacterium]
MTETANRNGAIPGQQARDQVARPIHHHRHCTSSDGAEDTATISEKARHRRYPRSIVPGRTINQYELIRPLGSGGMGRVYLARDTDLGRLVALKLLVEHTGLRARRMVKEARTTAQFNHENVVIIYEAGEYSGSPYLALEYVRGRTLAQWLRERAQIHRQSSVVAAEGMWDSTGLELPPGTGLSTGQAAELMIPVIRALTHAHKHGIVHRDLKPSNIMITESGNIKLLDFGVAKLLDEAEPDIETLQDPSLAPALTQTNAVLGTRMYMSPEQWTRGPVDGRADLWAVGLVLYEIIMGEHILSPLTPAKLASVADLGIAMPSVREEHPELGKLASIIDRCLRKRQEDRIDSARALLAELEIMVVPRRVASAVDDEDRCPYPGLAAFQENDADRFYGRDLLVREVVSRLAEQPFIAIVGPSGVGKSSFVRAGVIPALKRSDAWEAFIIRPGSHPLVALAELLSRHSWGTVTRSLGDEHSAEATLDDGSFMGTREALCKRLCDKPGYLGAQLRIRARRKLERILLFVDQFEEIYTLAEQTEREAFLACLAGVADDAGSPLRVIVSIRLDFLERVTESGASMTELSRGFMLLPPMGRDHLRAALERPLEALHCRFESDRLVDEMLDSLGADTGVLPLLQFTASKMWQLRDRQRRLLTEASYRHLGGVAGTLARHADVVVGTMSTRERQLVRAAFMRLVTPERTRDLVPRSELDDLAGHDREDMQRVVARLIDARLLTTHSSGQDDETVLELVHESLIENWPALTRWLSENKDDAAFLARLRAAASEWEKSGHRDGLVWRGQAASEAKSFYGRHQADPVGPLSKRDERYLLAVLALSERSQRRRRHIAIGLIAALSIVALTLSYLVARAEQEAARAEREAARAEREAARVREEAVRARNATRIAAAETQRHDPTTVLSLLREVESGPLPGTWSGLARWALAEGVAAAVFSHPAKVEAAALSSDGRRVVTAAGDAAVRMWNADGQGAARVFRGHKAIVHSVQFSRDNSRIVSASADQTVRVWPIDGSAPPLVFHGHTAAVFAAAFSPDGTRIVSASADRTVRIWRADGSGSPVILNGHGGPVYSAAFSPEGTRIVSASDDHTVRVWPTRGGDAMLILTGHTGPVLSAAFSSDGIRIVSGSADKTMRVWRADGRGRPQIIHGRGGTVYSAAFSPDNTRLVSATWDKAIRLWRADGEGSPLVLRGHRARVVSVAFSGDGTRIISASWDRSVRLWRTERPGQPLVLRGHAESVYLASLSPDGRRIASASEDKTVRIWPIDGQGSPVILRGHTGPVYSAWFHPDGTRVISTSLDKTVRIWPHDGRGPAVVLRGHRGPVWGSAVSPDGTLIASASGDKTVRIWPVDGRGEPIILRGHTEAVWGVAFSPDGTRVASASVDHTIRVWPIDGRAPPVVLRGHQDRVRSAVFNSDGTHLVSAAADKTVRVWRADGVGTPLVLRGHSGPVWWAEFNADETRIVSASLDKTIRIWPADGHGQPIVLRGHADDANSAMFSRDDTLILSASDDKTIRVWSDFSPLMPTDPQLWAATNYCIPIELRQLLLATSEEVSRANRDQCLHHVAQAHPAQVAPQR